MNERVPFQCSHTEFCIRGLESYICCSYILNMMHAIKPLENLDTNNYAYCGCVLAKSVFKTINYYIKILALKLCGLQARSCKRLLGPSFRPYGPKVPPAANSCNNYL